MTLYPELYIIGAMKSGTTTLSSHLATHNYIFLCPSKEPGYFSRDERYAKGRQWYLEKFAAARDDQIKVDASTCYSRWPYFGKTVERIFSVAPNAKFIYIMRDPVYRTYSHYKHRMGENISGGKDIISFDKAIVNDDEMMCASDYALQISKYLEYFKREQFYFTTLDLLVDQPQKIMGEIYGFLNLSIEDQTNSVKNIHDNRSGEKIKRRKNLQTIYKLRNHAFVQKLKFLFPTTVRTNIKAAVFSVLNNYSNVDDVKSELDKISTLDEKHIDYLRTHFNESIVSVELITGLNLSAWKKI